MKQFDISRSLTLSHFRRGYERYLHCGEIIENSRAGQCRRKWIAPVHSRLITCQLPGDEYPHGSFKPGDHLLPPLLIDGDDLGGNPIAVAAKITIDVKAVYLMEMIEKTVQLLVVNIKPSGEWLSENPQDFLEPLRFDEVRTLGDLQVR